MSYGGLALVGEMLCRLYTSPNGTLAKVNPILPTEWLGVSSWKGVYIHDNKTGL